MGEAFASTSANDEICPAPNRQSFEKKIWRVNNNLSKVHDELKQYWSEARREELNQIKTCLSESKKQYYACNEEENAYSQTLKDLQNQHQIKQREIQDLEDTDLIYKDLAHAKQKFASVEARYKRQKFSSIREEQLQVNELDRITRNIHKLGRYIPLVEQRKSLEAQLKDNRQIIREIRLKMRSARDKIQDSRHRLKSIQQPFNKLREVLADLKVEKRNLIEQYDDERLAYNAWTKLNKTKQPASTFPTAMLQDQFGDNMDLFHVQKSNCRRLIRYLEGLLSSSAVELRDIENSLESDNNHHHLNINDSSDSADELPESFKHLNVIKTAQVQKALCSKSVKRVVKKQAMPLSHGIDYIKIFNDIDVVPPKMLLDVPKVLEDVNKVLDFYENQTAIPTQEESEDYWTSPIPSLFSTAGSECLTGESPFTSPRSMSRTESSCSLLNKNGENSPSSPSSVIRP